MESLHPHSLYEEWPDELEERRTVARDIFGQHIVADLNGWSKIADEMLNKGYRHYSPTEEQKQFLDWIETLDENGRVQALAFVREMMHGVAFSIMNTFDGTSGSCLKDTHQEQLTVVMNIYSRDKEKDVDDLEPVETVLINSIDGEYDLHEELLVWEEKYGKS